MADEITINIRALDESQRFAIENALEENVRLTEDSTNYKALEQLSEIPYENE